MPVVTETPKLTYITNSQVCSDNAWEAAYRRFESPREEIEKFCARLRWFNVDTWDSDLEIVELFCGRGNALVAWKQFGFTHLEGVDLSATLLSEYHGPAKCYVADCRELPFDDHSKDVLAVHGGLHHLPELENDLATVLEEAVRVLRPGGRLLVVEPWNTPFLKMVHFAAANPVGRLTWDKLDAFHELYVHEQVTYDRWRNHPELILGMFHDRFDVEERSQRWGKLYFLGRKR
jgi:SAM-dependent methyltransferase